MDIISTIFFLFIFFAIKDYLNGRKTSNEPSDDVAIPAPYSPYKRKYRVMNQSEQALYINLQKNLGDKFIVLSKVRLEDFVEVEFGKLPDNVRFGFRNKIKSRHIDFLICDMASTKPLLAIELDGSSHNNYNRMKRDDFVDSVYKAINLPIQHIRVGSDFSQESLLMRNILLPQVVK